MGVVEFIFGAFSGVAGNMIYESLKRHFGKDKLNKLVEYKQNNNFENFKQILESAMEFNQTLAKELKDFANQKSVTQNNTNGDNFYSNGDQTNIGVQNITHNYETPKDDSKKF